MILIGFIDYFNLRHKELKVTKLAQHILALITRTRTLRLSSKISQPIVPKKPMYWITVKPPEANCDFWHLGYINKTDLTWLQWSNEPEQILKGMNE